MEIIATMDLYSTIDPTVTAASVSLHPRSQDVYHTPCDIIIKSYVIQYIHNQALLNQQWLYV